MCLNNFSLKFGPLSKIKEAIPDILVLHSRVSLSCKYWDKFIFATIWCISLPQPLTIARLVYYRIQWEKVHMSKHFFKHWINFFSLLLVLMMGRFSCGFPFALQIYAFFMVSHYYKKGMQLDEERYAACRHWQGANISVYFVKWIKEIIFQHCSVCSFYEMITSIMESRVIATYVKSSYLVLCSGYCHGPGSVKDL